MLHYQRSGSGKVIVFIHGNSQSLQVWDGVINQTHLTSFTTIAIDLPGHGKSFRSETPETDYTIKGLANLLKDFLLQLPDQEYILVASSLSTNLVSEIILQLPKCKGLFLIGASVVGNNIPISDIVQPSPFFGVTFDPKPTDDELKGFMNTVVTNSNINILNECVKLFWLTDPSLRLQEGVAIGKGEWSDEINNLLNLKYPVAIIYGQDEKIVFPQYLKNSGINIWTDQIIEIPACGHYCNFDQPEKLSQLIKEYANTVFK